MVSPVIQRASSEARNATTEADIVGLADPLERLHAEDHGLALVGPGFFPIYLQNAQAGWSFICSSTARPKKP
jgi:hypothetical protein